jgi:hypothetical protein
VPCERCGADRIITRQRVLCPNCDHVLVLDTHEILENRMEAIDSKLSIAIDSTDYNQTFGSAIVNRELAAKAIIYLPTKRRYAVNEWLAYTYLLRNLQYSKKNGISNFTEILDLSREMVQFHNEIRSLELGLAVAVKSGDKENFEWTEREPLSFVPEEAYNGPDFRTTLAGISDRDLNIETAMLQEGLMLPIWMVLLSEDISRILKRCCHSRILPFIKDASQARKFVEISRELSIQGLASNILQGVNAQGEGLIITDESGLQQIKQNLWESFHTDDVKWYFRSLISEAPDGKFDFGCSIIVRDEQVDFVCLPLYSLLMLAYATLKWLKEADLGKALNFKGGVVEDYFFRFVNAYNLSLDDPRTGRPLLRVQHPENPSIEIADIMGYNDKHVLVLECKFWNAPTLGELEEELSKFEEKLNYIQSNLKKFGFDKELKVVPIFYTPYAPYATWHRIPILPTAFAVGVKIGEVFSARKIKLIDKVPGLEKLFELIKGPAPFPIDASQLIKSLQPNIYNVHDGLVLKYDDTEITVFIDLPVSLYGFFLYLDITDETFRKLKQKGVSPGDIIRMITVNLNGTWTMVQLLYFKKIMEKSEWESHPEKVTPYSRIISLFKYFQKERAGS